MVRSIGAGQVIDYTQEDFTQSGQRYDLILDMIGNHSLLACRRVLKPKGIYIGVGVGPRGSLNDLLSRWITALVLSRFVRQNFGMFVARVNREDLTIMGDLMAAGKVTPVIDKRYRLSEVPDAIWYLEEGHARGKIVITLGT
jgi:NADPH:quinone reductase-like Zn-dependent oxidoreductase